MSLVAGYDAVIEFSNELTVRARAPAKKRDFVLSRLSMRDRSGQVACDDFT